MSRRCKVVGCLLAWVILLWSLDVLALTKATLPNGLTVLVQRDGRAWGHQRFFRPPNATLALVGDVDEKEALANGTERSPTCRLRTFGVWRRGTWVGVRR